jgi:hypothetical protein
MEIPQDIIDNVIVAVGDNNRLLKQCTLVSSSFLLPSRKQLFSKISLNSDQRCQGIHQFLVQNPVIQPFVRTIDITGWSPKTSEWMNGTSLLAILRLSFCRLEYFAITVFRDDRDSTAWHWNRFSSELKVALSNIISSSNLKTLYLHGIANVPITSFLHNVHLTTLELLSLSPGDLGGEYSRSLTRAGSNGVAPMTSHAVIDQCVWNVDTCALRYEIPLHLLIFSLIQDRKLEGHTQSIFLPFMCLIRFFEVLIIFNSATRRESDILSSLMRSLCISLTSSPATLEHLKFHIYYHSDYDSEFYTLCDANIWSHLDSIATHPTCSRLQRVDIQVEIADELDENEVLEALLELLPLLRAKGILFVKVTVM